MRTSTSSIVDRGARAIARRATPPLSQREGALPGQGRRAHRAAQGAGQLAPAERAAAGKRAERGQAGDRGSCWRGASRRCRRRARGATRRRAIDVTPARARRGGRRAAPDHAARIERIDAIFRSIGFDVADGPEIEDDFYNFTALNTPEAIRRARCTTRSTSRSGHGHGSAAHAHLPVQIRYARAAPPADQGDRAGQGLPGRLRRDPLADVPPGRGAVGRRGHQFRRPEGLREFLRAFFEREDLECASGRRTSRSPSPRPRST